MDNKLVFCYDCDQYKRKKDCAHTDNEGYICFECIGRRRKKINREEINRLEKEFLNFYPKIEVLLTINRFDEKAFDWFKEIIENNVKKNKNCPREK